MPVRVNLLAEALEQAEERRRDPVKRAIWLGGFLVALALLWFLSLLFNSWQASAELAQKQARWQSLEKDFAAVTQNQHQRTEIDRKLLALHELATNRFLVARPLHALQSATRDSIQVSKLRLNFAFAQLPETKTITNADKTITPGKLARASEKITLTIEAKDFGAPLDNEVSKFKDAIAATSFFRSQLKSPDDIRMTGLVRQTDPSNPAKTHVSFTLECKFPEQVR
ncbi:MAG: hypothetical protein HYY24_01900 [Verrucomicrobia bacterium]|nr:hypothetical protein [Verrucomicrobiota bacterium]